MIYFMGPFIVIGLRLVLPLSIFRWPLFGGILAMIIDALDVVLITFINQGEIHNYHQVDKYMDMYYLTIEAIKTLTWRNKLAKNTSIVLYLYRFIGFVLFESTKLRIVLFFFPNLFENFYLFYLLWLKFLKTNPVQNLRRLLIILVILLIPKMAQEYLLHYLQAQPWHFIRTEILHMNR